MTYQKPAFGRMHARPAPHSLKSLFALPREGTGDYRHPTAKLQGQQRGRRTGDGSAVWHNPGRLALDGDHRDYSREPEYIPQRNGAVTFRPYVWRVPGWEKRARAFGLDLAQLAIFDAEIDAAERRRKRQAASMAALPANAAKGDAT